MKPTNLQIDRDTPQSSLPDFWLLSRRLLTLHVILALIGWFNLPTRIPTHFGLTGVPDAWSSPSFFSWFFIVAVSFGGQLLLSGVMSPKAQDGWNIPEKERFLRLTPEQQLPVLNLIRAFGGFATSCFTLIFFAVHVGVYLVAQGYAKELPWYIHLAIFGPVVCLVVGLIPWSRAVQRTILQASSADPMR